MDETTAEHDGADEMTAEEKRRDQLLAAPGAVESDADPRIEVTEHDGVKRIDIAPDAAVRPGNPYEEPRDGSSSADDGSLEGPDIEVSTGDSTGGGTADATGDDTGDGTAKPGGLGQDGTIPNHPSGVAAGHTGEPSNFEPEEDEDAPSH